MYTASPLHPSSAAQAELHAAYRGLIEERFALRLTDHVASVQRDSQVGLASAGRDGYRGVRGERRTDLLRFDRNSPQCGRRC